VVRVKKNSIRWVLGAVLALDLILAGINWQMAASPGTSRDALLLLRRQHSLLQADTARAELIRNQLPEIEQQGDLFFTSNLRPSGTGYSSLVSDLGSLAAASGLQAENYAFRQHQPDKRGVMEVEIGTVVNGDYASVVRFINGLERSDTFYVLDGLSLAAGSSGQLRLNLQLRTYFRTT
jgi:Tfp pilus assembly protein PilO